MKRLDELFKVSTKWGLYSTLPLFLVICFASREIMTVVFGSGYETAALPLAILAVGQLINVGTGAVGLLLIMTGHQSRWFLISAVALFISIGLNWLLIPRLGLVGAALGTVCAVGGLFSAGLLQVKRCLGLWPYDVRYLKGLLATTLAAIALLLLSLFDIGSPALKLLTTLAVSVGVFGFALLLLGLDTEDREFVRLIQLRMGLG